LSNSVIVLNLLISASWWARIVFLAFNSLIVAFFDVFLRFKKSNVNIINEIVENGRPLIMDQFLGSFCVLVAALLTFLANIEEGTPLLFSIRNNLVGDTVDSTFHSGNCN